MITSTEVFNKIKAMSLRTLNPQHRILLDDLHQEIQIHKDTLLVLLIELENRGLIKIYNSTVASVSLTNYGNTNSDPPGGYNSEEM